MIFLSSIIQQFQSQLLVQYRGKLLPSHHKVLSSMKHCRTRYSPRMAAQCTECDQRISVPHSCGDRHCPHCQNYESQQWLERQLKKQVPADYFLLTFTLPFELRPLAWHHQRIVYALLIRCCWETIHTFSLNDKKLQGTPGAIAVLHTHARNLDYHPHVHLAVPAAAIDAKKRLWRTKTAGKKGYLFNHNALAKVFRAKMLEAITQAGLTLPASYPQKWVVDCRCVGAGDKALVYLGRYLYRGVIQEKNIVACKDGMVTFRYQNSKTKRMEYRTVSGAKFLWLLLQHVLPKGFRRARNFGFLHPNSKRLIVLLHLLLKFDPARALVKMSQRPQWICPCCGARMQVIDTRLPPLFLMAGRIRPAMES